MGNIGDRVNRLVEDNAGILDDAVSKMAVRGDPEPGFVKVLGYDDSPFPINGLKAYRFRVEVGGEQREVDCKSPTIFEATVEMLGTAILELRKKGYHGLDSNNFGYSIVNEPHLRPGYSYILVRNGSVQAWGVGTDDSCAAVRGLNRLIYLKN